jgi:hypothetical protein
MTKMFAIMYAFLLIFTLLAEILLSKIQIYSIMTKIKKFFRFDHLKYMILIFYTIARSGLVLGQFSVKVMDENFNSNARRWDIRKDSSSEMSMNGGQYLLRNKIDGVALSSSIDIPQLQSENFRISAVFSMIKGIENNGFGILWGATDLNNEYEFMISANGFFKVSKWENGNKEDIIGWTYHSAINKWELSRNELKIECNTEIIRFYINDNYVAATKYYKPFGQKIGFILNETMEVSIDEIIAENLTRSFSETSIDKAPSIRINKFELLGVDSVNVIRTGEKAYLNIDLTNIGTASANDLIVSILAQGGSNGLLYNQFSMIDKLDIGGTKQITIPIEADENIPEQNMKLKIELSTIDKKIINTDSLSINIRKTAIVYHPDEDNSITKDYMPKENSNDMVSDCTSTCISAGVVTLITAIISAIFK